MTSESLGKTLNGTRDKKNTTQQKITHVDFESANKFVGNTTTTVSRDWR